VVDRRRFLQGLLAALGATALGSFIYPLVRFLSPRTGGESGKQLRLAKSEIPPGGAKNIQVNDTPAIVINRPDKGFIVLSKVCTHLGCLVDYEPEKKRLLCPCHAGTYDLEGRVTSGPPPKPLQKFPLKIEGEDLVIG
jgi:cytochrome b6-f complex iron-sulfur subunit